MFLCFKCFVKSGYEPDEWDKIKVDDTVRKVCEVCGLKGFYIREVPTYKEAKN